MSFSESCWRPHPSYISDMASTLSKSCGTQRLTKILQNKILNAYPMVFQCLYAIAARLQFREVTKTLHALFGRGSLEGVHVHDNAP